MTKKTPKPPSKLSITRLAKHFCVTVPAAKKKMTEAGLFGPDGKPSPDTLKNGAAEIRTTEDGGSFPMWTFDAVRHLFIEPSEKDRAGHFKNRYELEDKLLQALKDVVALARKHKAKLTEIEDERADECAFNDPHFLGGPCACLVAGSLSDVTAIFDKAEEFFSGVAEKCPGGLENPALAPAKATLRCGREWLAKQVSR